MSDERISEKLIGRRPRRTVIQLVVASILVGAFLAIMGISPGEFWRGVFDFMRGIVGWLGDSVGEVFGNLATYFLFGAAIVIPIWIVSRIVGGSDHPPRKG